MKRTSSALIVAGLALAGCGSSKGSSAAPAATTVAPTTVVATTVAAAPTTTAAAAAGGGIAVTEKEFTIALAAPLAAGANTLAVTNSGSFPHELKIIKADSFDALPKGADGTVDETKLAADAIVGKLAKVAGGASGSLAVTLAPGKYVLVCNLGTGANSHAAKGMHMDVTIG